MYLTELCFAAMNLKDSICIEVRTELFTNLQNDENSSYTSCILNYWRQLQQLMICSICTILFCRYFYFARFKFSFKASAKAK